MTCKKNVEIHTGKTQPRPENRQQKAVSQIRELLKEEETRNPGTLRALAPKIPSHYLGFHLLAESNKDIPRKENACLEKKIHNIILEAQKRC